MFHYVPTCTLILNYSLPLQINNMVPKCISYIIAYYYQANQNNIGIINHISNLLLVHGSACRKPTLRSGKNWFNFIFLKQRLWQELCYGCLIFLFLPDEWSSIFPTNNFSLIYIESYSWVVEAGIEKNSHTLSLCEHTSSGL